MRELLNRSRACALALLFACGGQSDTPADDMTPAAPAVEVVAPQDGAVIDGGQVVVELTVANLTIVPAGDQTPNSGHHHLFLDRDVSPAGQVIPAEAGFIVHLGTGATSYTFENVAAGEHRLIAVVADFAHVPLQPWVVDTVRFTVR